MRVDLVFGFRGKLCDVVKWSLLFCCVCFSEIPVAGESRSSLIVITGEVKDAVRRVRMGSLDWNSLNNRRGYFFFGLSE